MFMTNRWKRSEKRALLAGLILFGAALAGFFSTDSRDSLLADRSAEKSKKKSEIRKVAGEAAATAEFDAKMEAAMDEASSKLDDFVAVLKKPAASQKDFAVKYLVEQGDEGEYLWANEVKFDGKQFTGKVANEPQFVKTVKFGQPITLKPEEIDDWMYVEDGKLKGGYTIRCQRNMLQGADRKKFDEQFKFKFE